MKVTQKPRLHQDWIDAHAYGIVKALQKHGHTTYLVGGCVRDLLLGIQPKDYDIATTARPNEVKRIIYKSYVIGRRFRLVLVKRDDQQFEVATFRREIKEDENAEDLPEGDNVFGTPEQDANRRDFTVNGLFYDPIHDDLIDFCNGLPDLETRLIRMIGEPNARLCEDPIRTLRALRLAHKLKFGIEPELRAAMQATAETLKNTALPRRREEFLKLLRLDDPGPAFLELYDLGILKHIAPHLHEAFEDPTASDYLFRSLRQFHDQALDKNNPTELFGFLILAYVRAKLIEDPHAHIRSKQLLENQVLMQLMRDELGMFKHEQSSVTKALHMQSILVRRPEFERKGERRQMAILKTEAFPMALKMAARDVVLSPADWHFWYQVYQNALPQIDAFQEENRSQRRRTRRPRRRSRSSDGGGSTARRSSKSNSAASASSQD